MPSTSTKLTVREPSASRTGLGRGQIPLAAACARLVVDRSSLSAGVAQLVERQPSKLNVASSNLVSRSVLFLNFGAPTPKLGRLAAYCRGVNLGAPTPRLGRLAAYCRGVNFGAPTPKLGRLAAYCRGVNFGGLTPRLGRLAAYCRGVNFGGLTPRLGRLAVSCRGVDPGAPSGVRAGVLSCFAHLAQLVEHVLGKDEVTSSILVVGSKRLGHASGRLMVGRRLAVGPWSLQRRVARRFAVGRDVAFAVTIEA
jgi:hypothetical protein